VREAEVDAAMLRERLASLPPEASPAVALLLARLTRRLERGRRRAAAWCSVWRITRIRRRVTRAFALRGSPVAAVSAPAIRARLERLEGRARGAVLAAADGRDESLHAARIATKRLRYALERGAAMGPPFEPAGEPARLERLAAAQEVLGRIRDLSTLQTRVARFSRRLAAAHPGSAAAFEPVLALIASERETALRSAVPSLAALDPVPARPLRLGLAGGRPHPGADQR
jgi:CHAD domain-containing protein